MANLTSPDQLIRIEPARANLAATWRGRTIALSRRVLILHEESYPGVRYFHRADVRMSLLLPTDHVTRCPRKGLASYFTIRMDGEIAENAAWSYETPHQVAMQIAGYVAFDPMRVDVAELLVV